MSKILEEFIKEHADEFFKERADEIRLEGQQEGIQKANAAAIRRLLADGSLSVEKIADLFGQPLEFVKQTQREMRL